MGTPSRVFQFIAPHFVKGNDVQAGKEFEAIQKYIYPPDILYRYEQVAYSDLWTKTTHQRPHLLHIVAHGNDGQLLAADAYLQHLEVDAHFLAAEVKAHFGSHLQYVYLGVCDSVGLARSIAAQGYTVLCFEGKVEPEKGVFFAETFYKFFLQEKKDFYTAFTAAKNSWKANGYHDNGVVPRFYCAESTPPLQFIWNKDQYKALLEKVRSARKPRLLEELFDELRLDASRLEPFNLHEVYQYLKGSNALFPLRDRAETYFLHHKHLYTEAFMDIEEGLLKPYLELPSPAEIQKQSAIAATSLDYKRPLGWVVGKKRLTSEGLELLAKELVLPLGLDFNRVKAHLLGESLSLKVCILPDGKEGAPMNTKQFLPWLIGQKSRFFVLRGAAGSGKTTFLVDTVKQHFQRETPQKIFIARFSDVEKLKVQLGKWEKDAIGNILILDALDELYDGSQTIFDLLTQKDHPVRAFSKVVLGFRDTFLTANENLEEAIEREDWVLLHMAPLQFLDVERYLRESFPVNKMQKEYGDARRFIMDGDSLPPKLRDGVTPFVLYHIQFLLEAPPQDGPLTYWDVMNRLVEKILDKGSPQDRRNSQVYKQKMLEVFKAKVLQAYQQGEKDGPLMFTQQDLENLSIDERLLRNFSFLSIVEGNPKGDYTFSHSNFIDYFLALLLFEGHIRELDFDKSRYPDAYRLYQISCWKRIAPKGVYQYDWDPLVASTLPCFAFQVMVRKQGGQLPLRHPSISKYFRNVFKDWNPVTWNKAKKLAAQNSEGADISGGIKAFKQRSRWGGDSEELAQLIDFKHNNFRHPLYRDVFAFLYYQEQGRNPALDFLDKSPFGWLFRYEQNWLEYGEQAAAYSLVYPVKENAQAYNLLQRAIGVDTFTAFDQEVYAALQTPAILEQYYEHAKHLHIQVHPDNLPARLLERIPFPEQFEELSIGGNTALVGDWDLRAFENLEMLDLSGVDIKRLRITGCPPLLNVIMHPAADQLQINGGDKVGLELLKDYLKHHWTQEVPDTPIPPDLVEVEGGAFEMGKGWFEAFNAFLKDERGQELPDEYQVQYPSYQAQVDTFYMARYPVTVGEFARFVRATGYRTRAERFGFAFATHIYTEWRESKSINMYTDYLLPGLHWRHSVWGNVLLQEESADLPVVYISFEDAIAYAQWLTDTIGNGGRYRLPTEAEWEYAARGGRQSEGYLYAGSDTIDEVAQYLEKAPKGLRRVGGAHLADMDKPNELGLYDMSGNVYEWCLDWFGMDYFAHCKSEEPVLNPTGPEKGTHRVIRGGSWIHFAVHCRTADRYGYLPDRRDSFIGFRLVFVP